MLGTLGVHYTVLLFSGLYPSTTDPRSRQRLRMIDTLELDNEEEPIIKRVEISPVTKSGP